MPDKDEKPVDKQFYARDDKNEGTLYYNGILREAAESVFLKVYADDKLIKTESQVPKADKTYALVAKFKPGLIQYKVEFGTKRGNTETVLHTAANLVCGDAYLIDGQSNAVATDWAGSERILQPVDSQFRFHGRGYQQRLGQRGPPRRAVNGRSAIGAWIWPGISWKARRSRSALSTAPWAERGSTSISGIPANPTDATTIYGRLLQRVREARLTHGIRGALWHQGEADQGAARADRRLWLGNLPAVLRRDVGGLERGYPNIQHYYVFQIWPNACSQGGTRHSDKLREVQRLLPRLYSNMSVMSTLGIKPEGGCHYPAAGYAEMARLMGRTGGAGQLRQGSWQIRHAARPEEGVLHE